MFPSVLVQGCGDTLVLWHGLGHRFRTLSFDYCGNPAAVRFLESEGLLVIEVLGHSMGGDSVLMFGVLSPLAREKSVVDVFVRFHMEGGLGEKFSMLHGVHRVLGRSLNGV